MAISKIFHMKDCGSSFHGKHLKSALDYITVLEKTQNGRLVAAVNCQVDMAFEQMKEILTQIKKYLPYCACVSMYASIKNLRDKTVEQLKELHRLGLGFLYIGLESGSDRILKQMKKGHTLS